MHQFCHTYLYLTRKKRKQLVMKMYGAQKAKGLLSKLKYKKFQASISKWNVLFLNDQMLWIVRSQKKFFNVMQSSFVGGHICIFLLLRLVTLLSANCVRLGWIDHWSFNYLTFHTHAHHTCLCSMNALFICVIVLN